MITGYKSYNSPMYEHQSYLIRNEIITPKTFTNYMNVSSGTYAQFMYYATHGYGYFTQYARPWVSIIQGESISSPPTRYNELLPQNYSDITIRTPNHMYLDFDTSTVKSWKFYIMAQSPLQQEVVPNTYLFEVVNCGPSSATVTSPVATKSWVVVSTNNFGGNTEVLTFDAFTFTASDPKCGF